MCQGNYSNIVYLPSASGTLAWTSDIPTKSSWNYDDVYSKLGHTHDDRYYTESEINSKLGAYLPLSGGTMTGTINANDNTSNTGIKFKNNSANLNALSN